MSRIRGFLDSDGTHRDKQHPEVPLAAREGVGEIGKGNWKQEENQKNRNRGKGQEFPR